MEIFKLVKSVEIYPLNGSDKANWIDVDRVKFPDVEWTEIFIKQHGSLTIKDKLDSKTRIFTAELQLYTPEAINLDVPYLWRIGLVECDIFIRQNYSIYNVTRILFSNHLIINLAKNIKWNIN